MVSTLVIHGITWITTLWCSRSEFVLSGTITDLFTYLLTYLGQIERRERTADHAALRRDSVDHRSGKHRMLDAERFLKDGRLVHHHVLGAVGVWRRSREQRLWVDLRTHSPDGRPVPIHLLNIIITITFMRQTGCLPRPPTST